MPNLEQSLRLMPRLGDVERPLVLYKVGMLGAAPLDFMPQLASEYDMPYVSSDKIRYDLMIQRDTTGMRPDRAQDVPMKDIKGAVHAQLEQHMQGNQDMALDMFGNSPTSRARLHTIAREGGGLAIGLAIETPIKVALRRVEAWSEADAFEIPTNRWARAPLEIAKTMINQPRRPSRSEGLFFTLDGRGTTDDMLEQVEAYLYATGLMDRFEDASS